jgi:hypothetical protein
MPEHDPSRRAPEDHRDDDLDDDDLDGGERDDPAAEKGGFTTKVLGDLARKALMTGIGAVFMSEDSLRSQLSEMKLPKEAMGAVINTADKTKREIIDVVARETRAFLSRLEVEKMVGRVLVGTTIEINTRIRILPKDGGGLGVSVERNESGLVKTGKDGLGERTEDDDPAERPRRGRRRRRDDT